MDKDIDQIRKTVQTYFEGVSTCIYERFLESWHPEARMCYVKEGVPNSVGREFWEDWCKKTELNYETTAWIESIDINGSVAVVRSKMLREMPDVIYDFTDFLTLLKDGDDSWVIINKAYNSEIKEK